MLSVAVNVAAAFKLPCQMTSAWRTCPLLSQIQEAWKSHVSVSVIAFPTVSRICFHREFLKYWVPWGLPLKKVWELFAESHYLFADSWSFFTKLMFETFLQDTVDLVWFNLVFPMFTWTFSHVIPIVIPRNKYTEKHVVSQNNNDCFVSTPIWNLRLENTPPTVLMGVASSMLYCYNKILEAGKIMK